MPLPNTILRAATPKSSVGGSAFDSGEEDGSNDDGEQAFGYELMGDLHRPATAVPRKVCMAKPL